MKTSTTHKQTWWITSIYMQETFISVYIEEINKSQDWDWGNCRTDCLQATHLREQSNPYPAPRLIPLASPPNLPTHPPTRKTRMVQPAHQIHSVYIDLNMCLLPISVFSMCTLCVYVFCVCVYIQYYVLMQVWIIFMAVQYVLLCK